ncbi:carbamoyltransferase family protein [Gymnodinialimonas sp.]
MTVILGLNAFHPDASACLLIDGKLVGAVAEERLGARNKHTMAFPENAIRWLLEQSNVRLRDVTDVAIARDTSANRAAKAAHLLRNAKSAVSTVQSFLNRGADTRKTLNNLAEICGEDPALVRYEVHNVEHHLAHIASAYYTSPFETETAGLSYDGSGDFASLMAARCEGTDIQVLDRVTLPSSLGHFYTAMCQFIGFELFGEEYKVMGLAPYGTDAYSDELSKVIELDPSGWFSLNPKMVDVANGLSGADFSDNGAMRMGRIYTEAMERLLGPARQNGTPVTQREMDIARSTQVRFEQAAGRCIEKLGELVPLTNLAMAGGCALNGVMNARIRRDFPVENVYLQCAASDDGTAIGAAFHCWHAKHKRTERFEMKHGFWGPEYGDHDIQAALEQFGLSYRKCASEKELLDATADYIVGGAVLGWYQGRSEWGPRALGNRSILANPAIADMKDTINTKIKKRESFRPFAPSLLREEVGRFFEQDIESPFMMHVVKFKEEWRKTFPAVTHVDGTGRLQSVEEENNPLYYRLLHALKARTGYGIVLNTSFNENEPVVDRPEQAIACFNRTDMDVLVLGRYIVTKPEFDAAALHTPAAQ